MGDDEGMRTPRYKLCDTCRRNDHKVAVRDTSGNVRGYCPGCFTGAFEHRIENGTELEVVYDHRARKFLKAVLKPYTATGGEPPKWHRTENDKVTKCGVKIDAADLNLERWDFRTIPLDKLCEKCLR